MIDFNTILSTAIQQAIDGHLMQIRQDYANKMGEMSERIAELEAKHFGLAQEEINLISTIAKEASKEAAEDALSSHCSEYEHDAFISDLRDVVLSDHFDIEELVSDAARNLSFEVTVV
jgi:uncharacterized tellurite resistance protein B-like protein